MSTTITPTHTTSNATTPSPQHLPAVFESWWLAVLASVAVFTLALFCFVFIRAIKYSRVCMHLCGVPDDEAYSPAGGHGVALGYGAIVDTVVPVDAPSPPAPQAAEGRNRTTTTIRSGGPAVTSFGQSSTGVNADAADTVAPNTAMPPVRASSGSGIGTSPSAASSSPAAQAALQRRAQDRSRAAAPQL